MDLKKIKQKLSALNSSSGGGGNDLIWKPEPGKNVIRLLPYIHNRDWPFLELFFHYSISKRSFVSPVSFGEPDPIVEKAEQLKSTGDKEDWKLARKIEPKLRVHIPILVRGKESEGVKFWGFSNQVYEELLKTMDDPDYGDITDLKTGMDITVEYEPADTAAGQQWPSTTIRVKPKQTVATESTDVVEKIKSMPKVEDIWKAPSYVDIEDMFQKFLNNSNDPEPTASSITNTDGVQIPKDLPADFYTSDEIPGKHIKPNTNVDDAFADMFG